MCNDIKKSFLELSEDTTNHIDEEFLKLATMLDVFNKTSSTPLIGHQYKLITESIENLKDAIINIFIEFSDGICTIFADEIEYNFKQNNDIHQQTQSLLLKLNQQMKSIEDKLDHHHHLK